MTYFQPRIPTKFTNAAGSAEFVFPLAEYAYEIDQPLKTAFAGQAGAHGEFDLIRDGAAAKGSQLVRVSFTAFDDAPADLEVTIDAMLQKLWSYGRGRLYTKGLDSGGSEQLRWTRGRALGMPRPSWQGGMVLSKAFAVSFECDPFWYETGNVPDSPFTIDSNPKSITVANGGNAPIYNAIFTLAGTFTNPVITNTTNGYRLQSSRDGASSNDRLRFDAGRHAVEFTNNGGTSWSNDYANFVRKAGQVHLMVLEPGNNSITVAGCSSGTLTVTAFPAWH